MLIHSGPAMAFAILLVASGAAKVRDPGPTKGALRAAGMPSGTPAVGAIAGAEVLTGLSLIVLGGPIPAVAMTLLYAGFAAFVVNALVKDLPISSCGCFGRADTPPSWIHAAVNLVAVGFSVSAVLRPLDVWSGLAGQALDEALPFGAFTIAAAYLLYGVLAVLPRNSVPETPVILSPTSGGSRP